MYDEITKIGIMLGGVKPSCMPAEKNWCGVDAGALHLVKHSIKPDFCFGDFDSISELDYRELKNNVHYIEKKDNQDETDTDFALNKLLALCTNLKMVNIYGATGKRLDHFFGNILLLNNSKYENLELNIIDDNNIITTAKVGENIYSKKVEYPYFSLVPIYEKTVVSISGAKYDVQDYELAINRPNATSNEFEQEQIIVKTNKKCLIIYSKD